jgi:hypothetical protein
MMTAADTQKSHTLGEAIGMGKKRLSDRQGIVGDNDIVRPPSEPNEPNELATTIKDPTPKQRAIIRDQMGYHACATCVTFRKTGVCPLFNAERKGGEEWDEAPVSPRKQHVVIKKRGIQKGDLPWTSGCDAVDQAVAIGDSGSQTWDDKRIPECFGRQAYNIAYEELEYIGLTPGTSEFEKELDRITGKQQTKP